MERGQEAHKPEDTQAERCCCACMHESQKDAGATDSTPQEVMLGQPAASFQALPLPCSVRVLCFEPFHWHPADSTAPECPQMLMASRRRSRASQTSQPMPLQIHRPHASACCRRLLITDPSALACSACTTWACMRAMMKHSSAGRWWGGRLSKPADATSASWPSGPHVPADC